jgi:hypothetical protein
MLAVIFTFFTGVWVLLITLFAKLNGASPHIKMAFKYIVNQCACACQKIRVLLRKLLSMCHLG